ncbi:uncharacterized protein FA14DRAFT_189791 [Meira miltonrushii]|uniref:Cyclin-D1-binding protein 1-like N-terminal domain-containing protein n=1 Tax=Meira miltonrushii TaxID=1280837 RepID=A0A316VE73_9BASI|nr:uncharacterized protein FA14DRAFT_189791 [Meira miltonrushii]PWN35856.1 hypothetical protein FA14DRAFT_189791 [Meira miltonrushii]
MEKEIQSDLLRLSILIATSLSTLSEPVVPVILEDGKSTEKSSEELSQQILGDLKTFITSVQKTCTNLTLALRPNAKQLESKDAKPNPISGLDDASLTAAKAQIKTILDDCIPKLIFLARKARTEATIFHYVPKTEEDLAKEKAEKEFVKSKGGHFVIPAHARETEKLEKIPGKGLGKAWSKMVSSAVFELLESLGELSKSYMDDRTKAVLQKASAQRDKVDGIISSLADDDIIVAKNAKEARQLALQATAVVWEVCDSTLNGSRKLLNNNREAVQVSWKARSEVLKDALSEFKQALVEGEDEGKDAESESLDADDPLAAFEAKNLDENQKAQAKKYLPFIKACCQFHGSVGEAYLSKASSDDFVDFDDLDQAAEFIIEAVDDLIAVLLYGDNLGIEEEGENDEEEAQADLDDAKEDLVDAICALRDVTIQDSKTGSRFDDQVKQIKEL